MSGSAAKARVHSAWLTITAGGAAGESQLAAVKPGPNRGPQLQDIEVVAGDQHAFNFLGRRAADAPSVTVHEREYAIRPESVCVPSRYARYSGIENMLRAPCTVRLFTP